MTQTSSAVGTHRPWVWHRFFSTLMEGPTRTVADEIAGYLERHERDLPPEVRILLERRGFGP